MRDYYVTVCSHCLTASCWHGIHMCRRQGEAGTREILASKLRALGREHSDNFSPETLREVCGTVREAEFP